MSVVRSSVFQMSAVRVRLLLLLLAATAAVSVSGSVQTLFVAVGDTIKLSLGQPITDRISGVVWNRDPNMVAEWNDGVYRSYGPFKDRTTVDNTTGVLEISAGTTGDSGRYQAEVNGRLQDTSYQVEVINRVPKPTVWIRPLSCGPSSPQCNLVCDGPTEGTGRVTYSWIQGDEGWKPSDKEQVITNNTARFRTFTCRMENSVSHQESEPRNNPFFQEESSSSFSVAAVVCVILLFIIFATLGLVTFRNWTKIKGYFSDRTPVSQTPPKGDDVALS